MKGTYSSYDPVTGKGTIDIDIVGSTKIDLEEVELELVAMKVNENESESDFVMPYLHFWGPGASPRKFHFTVPLDFAKVVNISPGMPVEFDMSPINPYEATNLRY
ncbi:hypothetical protein [Pseudomonas kribbensis]|uniref:hypothetical protein n=1 Tax=Pseudomonas kribbensis TaxID=1628086 RepID=UPI001F3CE1D6|nr:hypothetical protein [Pseudomonas kribbensis]UIN52756.1 hypothetical protein LXN51_17300 [Pseudomonas kribbensis]